jgi:hypothetical protein
MGLPISRQLAEAAAGLAAGAAMGLLYDFFRVIRRASRHAAIAALCDVIFCAAAGVALFALGMSVGRGRQRVYVTVLAALGWMLYLASVSRAALFVFDRIYRALAFLIAPVFRAACKILKIFEKTIKYSFHFLKKCYIMNVYTRVSGRKRADGERILTNEAEKGRYYYEVHRARNDSLRDGETREHNDADKHGESGARRAAVKDHGKRGLQRRAGIRH